MDLVRRGIQDCGSTVWPKEGGGVMALSRPVA